MRLANIGGRASLVVAGGYRDVAAASDGRFDTHDAVFADWLDFLVWAETVTGDPPDTAANADVGPAVPRPRQVFGVGFNYAAHVAELAAPPGTSAPAETEATALPLIFTKFPSSIIGPTGDVELPDAYSDFEVELVVAIGAAADRVSVDDAWSHVAGLLVGQDISARRVQFRGPEQHVIAKSFRTFAPLGPYLVTPDELPDPTDLRLRCWVNDDLRQSASTLDMIYPVADLIALLSAVTTLMPGDLIYTGTPAGVGGLEKPPRYLAPGDVIVSEVEGLGRMENRCVAGRPAPDLGTRWQQ
jgi:2-keto-4-pentenoate hydratase/2-oxohepta-3-ene-1,7-dioic acid hydratase in catechol pathway